MTVDQLGSLNTWVAIMAMTGLVQLAALAAMACLDVSPLQQRPPGDSRHGTAACRATHASPQHAFSTASMRLRPDSVTRATACVRRFRACTMASVTYIGRDVSGAARLGLGARASGRRCRRFAPEADEVRTGVGKTVDTGRGGR